MTSPNKESTSPSPDDQAIEEKKRGEQEEQKKVSDDHMLDHELDQSMFASDPPSSTQPHRKKASEE